MSVKVEATPNSNRELVIARIIDAPREKVFQAWTDPKLMTQWFAPRQMLPFGHYRVADAEPASFRPDATRHLLGDSADLLTADAVSVK
jgi:uncharacterized protein YndB with AHSA1/START domain